MSISHPQPDAWLNAQVTSGLDDYETDLAEAEWCPACWRDNGYRCIDFYGDWVDGVHTLRVERSRRARGDI